MERLYPTRRFKFNDETDDWKEQKLTGKPKFMTEAFSTLHLIDEDSGEKVEAKILFLYSTLIYSGYACRGIVRIGNSFGTAYVTGADSRYAYVLFKEYTNLSDKAIFDSTVKEIIDDLDDDCRYSEAIHARDCYNYTRGMNGLVEYYHYLQRRNNNPDISYIEHLYGVSSILESVVNIFNEIDEAALQDMKWAALGHDLLEDTDVDPEVIPYVANDHVLKLIQELTNPNDDAHTDDYMEQLSNASEEGRLVKYADLIENTSSFAYSLHEPNIENPEVRAKEFYLPILEKTTAVLAKTEFTQYPKTAEEMRRILKVYSDLLVLKIKMN